jgi:hypothetical protein
MSTRELLTMLSLQHTVCPGTPVVNLQPYGKAKPKECFDNCSMYLAEYPDSYYVLGYVFVDGLPIEHAWVRDNDKHLDITLADTSKFATVEYFSFYIYNYMELLDLMCEYGNAPTLYEARKHNQWDEK